MDKYCQKYIITNDCMDINHRLTPISAIMYFQDSFARYMTLNNLAAFDIVDDNLYWIVSEFNIEFCSELPFWSEEIEVSAWVSEITKLKIFADFELKQNGIAFAKGDSSWFILNTQTKRPILTNIVSDKIKQRAEFTLNEHKKFTQILPKEEYNSIKHTINLSDIDFNNHVNNKSYINLAQKSMQEYCKNHSLKKLSVKYSKESFLGDTLVCKTSKTEFENTFIHKIMLNDNSICDIITSYSDKIEQTDIKDKNLAVRIYR